MDLIATMEKLKAYKEREKRLSDTTENEAFETLYGLFYKAYKERVFLKDFFSLANDAFSTFGKVYLPYVKRSSDGRLRVRGDDEAVCSRLQLEYDGKSVFLVCEKGDVCSLNLSKIYDGMEELLSMYDLRSENLLKREARLKLFRTVLSPFDKSALEAVVETFKGIAEKEECCSRVLDWDGTVANAAELIEEVIVCSFALPGNGKARAEKYRGNRILFSFLVKVEGSRITYTVLEAMKNIGLDFKAVEGLTPLFETAVERCREAAMSLDKTVDFWVKNVGRSKNPTPAPKKHPFFP